MSDFIARSHAHVIPPSDVLQEHQNQVRARPLNRQRSLFTEMEDAQLKMLVETRPSLGWDEISRFFLGKNARQVRDRYRNYLAPEIDTGPWTEEEDERLREKIKAYGRKWTVLKQFFHSRSPGSIKNRWHHLSSGRPPTFNTAETKQDSTADAFDFSELPRASEIEPEFDDPWEKFDI
jgi:hypothetical protein